MALTNGKREAVSLLASLLRPSEGPCPNLLLGAGASFRSGVPTTADAVRHIAKIVYSDRVLRNSVHQNGSNPQNGRRGAKDLTAYSLCNDSGTNFNFWG
jgi:hypothetical protein